MEHQRLWRDLLCMLQDRLNVAIVQIACVIIHSDDAVQWGLMGKIDRENVDAIR